DGTGDLTNGKFTKNHLQLANFTVNTVISNTTINQLTFGYQYWNNLIDSHISAPLVTFPSASFGTNGNVPQQSFQRKWQFKDDVSKTIGRHTLKAGADYIWNPVEGGFFEFNSTLEIDFVADPSTILSDSAKYPQGFATAGAVGSMSISNGDPYFLVATKQLGLYLQDDWKVTRRLTLNLGLRWDKDFNMIGGADIKTSRTYLELVALNSPISNPYVSKIAHDDNKDFSPRVGFAYDVTGAGKHVLRGGFGLYYGNVFQNIPLFMEQLSNPTVFQTVLSLSSPSDPVPGTGQTLGQWQYGVSPLPAIPPPSAQVAPFSVGRLMDPNYRNPETEEFNGGYSWSLNPNTVIEAEYTHVLGLHENKTINIDQKVPVGGVCCTRPLHSAFAATTLPELASVRTDESVGRSHYDGMNISLRRRMSHYISAFVPAYCAANTSDPKCASNGTAQAQLNLQNCFYGQCVTQLGIPLSPLTSAKYDPLRGDPFFELDLRLAKNIKIRERMNLQLVAQAFNLTNRANYGNDFNNNIASPSTFGHPGGFINPASTIV